jgi:heme-degrading monooxygenase HmoA
MFARIGSWKGGHDELDLWLERSRRDVVPGVMAAPGAEGVLLFLDRDGGEAMTITIWRDEAAMQASEQRRAELQHGTSAESGAAVVTRRYEIVDAVWPA